MSLFIIVLTILLIPSIAEAWGLLTHVSLGYELIDLGKAFVPAGIYTILKKYRNDFLYGNISADILLGRRYQVVAKNTHNWGVAWKVLKAAESDRRRAFAYGYLMHLCADSVVHNIK